jgi:hypothetical protein
MMCMAALTSLVLGSISMGMRDQNGDAFIKSGGIRPRMRSASLVQVHAGSKKQLREYWKEHRGGLWQWRMYCKERHIEDGQWTEADVEEFFKSDSLEDIEFPSDELLSRFDNSELRSIKWLWAKYTNEAGFRVGDPRKVPHSVLQNFLDDYVQEASQSDKDMASAQTVNRLKSLGTHADYERICDEKAFGLKNPAWFPECIASSILTAFGRNPADHSKVSELG